MNQKPASELPPMVMSLGSMTTHHTGKWRTARPVVDIERCTLCKICWKFCPEGCIQVVDDRIEIDLTFCKGCMICAEECPRDAISEVTEQK